KLHDYLIDKGIQVTLFYDVNPRLKGVYKRNKQVVVLSEQSSVTNGMKFMAPCLIAVSARGARRQIDSFLSAQKLQNGADYLFVA
nr:hypothetical protein [Acidiferrobacterales bacterium]